MDDLVRKEPASPFVPGTGGMPPVLAGRERQKRDLQGLCSRVASQGSGAHRPAVLIGPRGNGKTVLIQWLQTYAERLGVDTDWVTPRDIPTLDALAERVKRSRLRIPGGEPGVEGKYADAGIAVKLGLKGRTRQGPPDLTQMIAKRSSKKPFALLIDEAHTLDAEVGASLLNAAQRASAQSPFLLVLAGTPDLEDAIDSMSATFWSRCMTIPVGRLNQAGARLAIEEPLVQDGISLASDSCWEKVLEAAQGYPYFVQLLGESLWNTAFPIDHNQNDLIRQGQAVTCLDEESVDAALATAEEQKQVYYGRRCAEIEKLGLTDCACRVAECFLGRDRVHARSVREAIGASVGAGEAETAFRLLRHIGYIWSPSAGNTRYFEPGIPSLMDFVTIDAAGGG